MIFVAGQSSCKQRRGSFVARCCREFPELSLFWLDDDRYVGTTVQLLSWLGMCEPAVRRFAIGYRMAVETEVAVRSAGAHLYLAADGNLRAMLEARSHHGCIVEIGRLLWSANRRPTPQSLGCAQGPPPSTLVGHPEWSLHRKPLISTQPHNELLELVDFLQVPIPSQRSSRVFDHDYQLSRVSVSVF